MSLRTDADEVQLSQMGRWEYQNIALVCWKDISSEVFRIIPVIFKLSNEDTTRKHLYWKWNRTEVNILAQEIAIWHDRYFKLNRLHRSELPLYLVMKPLYERCRTYQLRKETPLFWKIQAQRI